MQLFLGRKKSKLFPGLYLADYTQLKSVGKRAVKINVIFQC